MPPHPVLRGGAHAAHAAAASPADNLLSQVTGAVQDSLGNSSALTHPRYYAGIGGVTEYGDWKFPKIPYGAQTTILPVAFPITLAPVEQAELMQEQVQIVFAFCIALVIWMTPTLCINKKLCSQCFRRWLSKQLGVWFCLGLFVNIVLVSIALKRAKHISVNGLFFSAVSFAEMLSEQMEVFLIQSAAVVAIFLLWVFRKKIGTLLGFDSQVINTSLRDLLTGFSMKRFRAIEVSLWKAEELSVGFSSRTLFTRVTLGYNEAQHTRPQDKLRSSYQIKERLQLNYDPEDDTQRLSIMIKCQEVIGASVNKLLPAAGAVAGAVGGLVTPLGPGPGAAVGVITGTGAANSVGAEIAKVDLSSAMINRIRKTYQEDGASGRAMSTGPAVRWTDPHFQKVDLIPQGQLWLRIVDVGEA